MKVQIKNTTIHKIIYNKKAQYKYFIEQEFEAGIALQGWEVKSLRVGKVSICDSYIFFKKEEAYLFGASFQPLITSSYYLISNPMRNRKLLLKKQEIKSLLGRMYKDRYTCIPLYLYWQKNWIKIKIGIAKGKREHDKRVCIKEREWLIYKNRILRHINYVNTT